MFGVNVRYAERLAYLTKTGADPFLMSVVVRAMWIESDVQYALRDRAGCTRDGRSGRRRDIDRRRFLTGRPIQVLDAGWLGLTDDVEVRHRSLGLAEMVNPSSLWSV